MMIAGTLVLQLALVAAAGQVESAFYEAELLFDPVPNKHNHAPAIVECPNGDLLVSWYRGSRGERKADDTAVLGARRRAGETRWSEPFVLADFPTFPDCNTAMFIDGEKRLWLFWPLVLANTWESCLTQYRTSIDYQSDGPPKWGWQSTIVFHPTDFEKDMLNWLEAARAKRGNSQRARGRNQRLAELSKDKLSRRLGWQPRCKPTLLPSGRILLPLYSDTFSMSLIALSDDNGRSWQSSKAILGPGNIQPALLRRDDGTVVAYMRDGSGQGRVLASLSSDDGFTWGEVTATQLPNPGSGLDGVRLENGDWVLVYNDTTDDRKSLAVSLSRDQGRTWQWTRHLEHDTSDAYGKYHYPAVIQSHDGLNHVVYSHFVRDENRQHRRSMKHAAFNEAWILEGSP